MERLAKRLDLVVPERLRSPRLSRRRDFRALHAEIRNAALATPGVIGLRLYVEIRDDRPSAFYQSLGMKPGGYDVYEELWIGSKSL